MRPICWVGLGVIAYLLYRCASRSGGLGMVSTTEKHTTVYDSPQPGQAIHYFQKFNEGALDAYYSGNDINAAQQTALAQMALNNISTDASIRLGAKFEDTLEKMNPVTADSPILSSDIPPPPPF